MDLTDDLIRHTEHPGDVLATAGAWQARGDAVALAILTGTEGGAVRAPGALMAVNANGDSAGYLSGGCIDADVVLRAGACLVSGEAEILRYGAGSPFVDIQLPCGGALIVTIVPHPAARVVAHLAARLTARSPATLSVTRDGEIDDGVVDGAAFSATYRPKLRLRLAGRGADFVALARLASAVDLACHATSPDPEDLAQIHALPGCTTERLVTPASPPTAKDDAETAFVLLFHDRDWELPLLCQALEGDTFFIGAVGSRSTQARRREALIQLGVAPEQIDRIRGPIGLVPKMRDASMLAISALAEIVEAYHARVDA
ncbi:MAG: XdhC family protein [Pseudomonadota bacterium]